jgi:alpha-L-fucosidase
MRLLALIVSTCALITTATASDAQRADWLNEAKYGVFVHYLGGGPNWNKTVESFDVPRFAEQLQEAGAGYLVFTLGQNSGYYCSPNAAYDKYTGHKPGDRCSRRDLPKEIAAALKPRGIRFMLYLPSRSPQHDKDAMQGLSDVSEQAPAPQEFTRKWSEVIREWSVRYGADVSGWWFDGSYNTNGWDDLAQPCNWNTWAAACRAGNPQSILAFNPGTDLAKAFSRLTEQQDYTAGEQNTFEATPAKKPASSGLAWHILCHLGTSWAKADGPQLSDDAMIAYIRQVNAQKGAVTMDVNVTADGKIHAAHLAQLKRIGQALRAAK